MDSLNIIEKTDITVSSLPAWWDALLFIVIAIILLGYILFFIEGSIFKKAFPYGTAVCAVLSVLMMIIYVIGILTQSKAPTGRYSYEIEVTEETDLDYIYDNYDVISDDGRIWTIEDK